MPHLRSVGVDFLTAVITVVMSQEREEAGEKDALDEETVAQAQVIITIAGLDTVMNVMAVVGVPVEVVKGHVRFEKNHGAFHSGLKAWKAFAFDTLTW